METNPEVELAWEIIEETYANLFLTGKAGTGKTTFLKELKRQSPKRMIVLAPTGIAAINAGGVTVHSFFQLPLSPYIPGASFGGNERKFQKFSKQKRDIIRTLDLLVIDEISMVRADLLDAVDSVMRRYKQHNKPFGGVQLLLIGDLQQLAPVIKDDEWAMLQPYYDSPYFFSSKALNDAGYLTVELKTIYRQQDSKFISILNKIRDNKADEETLSELNKRYIPDFRPSAGSDYIRLTTHNHLAQTINEQELARLQSRAYSFEAVVDGTFPETSFPADKTLTLKMGAQVMFIKNDPEKRFFNGMIGEVVDVDDENIVVRGKNGGTSFKLEMAEWTNSKYTIDSVSKEIKETVEGIFRQYPVKLAWAITIHKSQGLTFEHAIIDASNSFAHGQTYVALSRCKSLEGLVLSRPLSRRAIISDETVDSYTVKINDLSPTKEALDNLKHAFTIAVIDELFELNTLKTSFDMLMRTIDEHLYRRYPRLLEEYKKAILPLDSLIDVTQKFKAQYVRILGENKDVANQQLQTRIHKAADYFYGALSPLVILCNKTKVEVENKTVKKQFDERLASFREELMFKRNILNYESGHEETGGIKLFTPIDYLKAKSRILLGLDPVEPSKGSGSKKRKPKVAVKKEEKIPTRDVSFRLFNEGKTIGKIAAIRGLSQETIFRHLLSFVREGHIEPEKLHPLNHRDEIMAFVNKHPDIKNLSEMKKELGDDVSYNEIRLVLELMDREDEMS